MLTPTEIIVEKIGTTEWRIVQGLYRGMRIFARCEKEIEIGEIVRAICMRNAGAYELEAVERVERLEGEKEKRCYCQN